MLAGLVFWGEHEEIQSSTAVARFNTGDNNTGRELHLAGSSVG